MNRRELKGLDLLKLDGCVKPTSDEGIFLIRSESNADSWYKVSWNNKKWTCECKDFVQKEKKCKHIWCLQYWLALKRLATALKSETAGNICPHCSSSESVVKRGVRYNMSGPKQTYYCKKCKKRFVERNAFLKMKNDALLILTALDLYFKGLSLRKVKDHLRQFYGRDLHHTTILKWIRKYSKLIGEYVQGLNVEFGDRWNADETIVAINSRYIRLWALMDYETKLLIAHKLSKRRNTEEAEALFEKGINRAGKPPLEVITDGFAGYHEALQKLSQKIKDTQQDSLAHFYGPLTGEINNNLVERFFGEIKQRTAAMRGVKSEKSFSDFLEGYLSIYNITKLEPEKRDLLRIIEKAYLKRTQWRQHEPC
jgi:transposase-like protein